MAQKRSNGVLVGIGIFKLVKVAILVVAGITALHWLQRGPNASLWHWIDRFNIDPARPLVQRVMGKASGLSGHKLIEAAVTSFTYAVLMTIEATGLLLRKRWGEYATVLITGSLLPFEIWELHKRFSGERLAVLIVNVAIVVYLIVRLRREGKQKREPEPRPEQLPAHA